MPFVCISSSPWDPMFMHPILLFPLLGLFFPPLVLNFVIRIAFHFRECIRVTPSMILIDQKQEGWRVLPLRRFSAASSLSLSLFLSLPFSSRSSLLHPFILS